MRLPRYFYEKNVSNQQRIYKTVSCIWLPYCTNNCIFILESGLHHLDLVANRGAAISEHQQQQQQQPPQRAPSWSVLPGLTRSRQPEILQRLSGTRPLHPVPTFPERSILYFTRPVHRVLYQTCPSCALSDLSILYFIRPVHPVLYQTCPSCTVLYQTCSSCTLPDLFILYFTRPVHPVLHQACPSCTLPDLSILYFIRPVHPVLYQTLSILYFTWPVHPVLHLSGPSFRDI